MELSYWNEESASSHREQSRVVTISAIDAKTIALNIEVSDHNACNGFNETMGTEHFKIPVDRLIELIKEHGRKFTPPRKHPLN